jgi:hypothetical protein
MNKYKYSICMLLSILFISTTFITGCTPSQNTETGQMVFEDDFKDVKSGWSIYKPDATRGGEYQQGEYKVWAIGKNTVIALNPKTRQQLGDFSAEVDVRITSEIKGAVMGIIYRLDNDGNYYRFAITDNQSYYVGKGFQGLEEEIKPMESSAIIKPGGEYNRLKVVCKGDNQDLYINDQKVGSVTDNTSLVGELGISFSNWIPSENYTFTNFKLNKLK